MSRTRIVALFFAFILSSCGQDNSSSLSSTPKDESTGKLIDTISAQQVLDILSNKEKISFLYVHASWCGPCKLYKNMPYEVLTKLTVEEKAKLNFVKFDHDAAAKNEPHLIGQFNQKLRVAAYPSFYIVKNDKVIEVERPFSPPAVEHFVNRIRTQLADFN